MEPAWLATLELTKTWYVEFEKRLKETMLARAKELKTKLSMLTEEQQKTATKELEDLEMKSTKSLNIEGLGIKRDINLVGTAAATLSFDVLEKLLNNCETLILALPLTYAEHVIPDCMLPTISTELNETLINEASRGFGSINNHKVLYNLLDSIAGFGYYSVVKLDDQCIINVEAATSQNPYVTVNVPYIEWGNLTNKSPLITARPYQVDKRIMDRLLNYCIANDPTVDQLMAYVRSMLSTYDTSRTGIFPTYETTIEEAIRSTFAALVLYKVNYSGLATMSAQALINCDLVTMLLQCERILNKNENMTNLLTGLTERALSLINIDVRKVAKSVAELEVAILVKRPKPVFIRWDNDEGTDDK
jgi:hypothetical protein